MTTPSLAPPPQAHVPHVGPGVVYVLPHYDAASSEHYAHVPHLLRELSQQLRVGVVVERGEVPPELSHLPFVRVLAPPGTSKLRRALRMLKAIHDARRAGYPVWFLRYSRAFLLALAVTRPVLHHRVLYWSSGQADLVDPAAMRSWWRGRLDRTSRQCCLRLADRVVTGPESMQAYMLRRWRLAPHRVRLLYNDIDTNRFTPATPTQRADARQALDLDPLAFLVLFVHRVAYRRGSRLLVPIAERLHATLGGTFQLVAVGDGPDLPLVQAQVAGSPAEASVHVLGAVPNAVLPDYFAAADCFLQPSYEEGMPRVLLEAMAAGLPVVSTAAGGSGDVLGPGYPYLFPVGDVAAMGDGLLELSRDAGLRRHWGSTLRARVEQRFDTRAVVPAFVDLVQETS